MDPGSVPQLPPVPPNIGSIAGPTLIGSLFNYFLFGILSVQCYIYHYSFPEDKLLIKSLVYSIMTVEILQICMNGADVFYWFARGYGNLLMLDSTYLSPFDTPMLGSIVALIIQLFFCYRIWTLRKSYWWISSIIGLISIVQVIGGIGGAVLGHNIRHFSAAQAATPLYTYMWLVGEAVADVFIAIVMTYLLLETREKTHSMSHSIVTRIVRLTVQSNSLTAGVALLSLILFVGAPGTTYFTAPTIFLGKLYSNSLLATFNHRIFLRHRDEPFKRSLRSQESSSTPSSNNFFAIRTTPSSQDSYNKKPVVQIDVETATNNLNDSVEMVTKPPRFGNHF
ncbi:hypothetical protein AMATHDRAFT_88171 [Amanita thiersii Skay4041]|uniref:DUF6534 domain-containing protein n=1 Tax=Amanita thiersii Skay4041 TaxID=703135 RepID=A0A2A9NG03_9AGAR|nr:hypothetical protein AMATHDRAFT_88171 [Amanita thiersii Skay4041]